MLFFWSGFKYKAYDLEYDNLLYFPYIYISLYIIIFYGMKREYNREILYTT